MSRSEKLAGLLETILDRLDGIEVALQRLPELEKQLKACTAVCIDARSELDELRVRLMQDANVDGVARQRDRKLVQEHEARIYRVERRLLAAE